MNARLIVFTLLGALLAGCSDGGAQHAAGLTPSTVGPTPSAAPAAAVRVNGTLLIPSGNAVVAGHSRRPQFLVSQTAGVTVTVLTHGSSTVVATSSFDVSSSAVACTAVPSGRTCPLTLSVAPTTAGASYDLSFTSYDAAPVSGDIPGTANVLATGVLAGFAVTSGALNTFAVTLSGTPARATFPATVLLSTGTPSTVPVVPAVSDAAGNTIIGTYSSAVTIGVSAGGTHTTIGLSSGSPGTSVVLSGSSDAALVQLNYDGNGGASYSATLTPNGLANTAPSTIPALGASGALGSGAAGYGATLTGVLPAAALTAGGQSVTYTVTEPGFAGTFVATVQTVSGACPSSPVASGAGSPATFTVTFASIGSCTITFGNGVTTLPSVTASLSSGTTSVGVVPVGTITEYGGSLSDPNGITAGPDGNLWFAEYGNGKIGKITTSGTITEYGGSFSQPVGITAGPDGNLWFAEYGNGKIGKITTSGTITEYGGALSSPFGITAGPDGNLWFTESGNGKVGKITTSGTITEYGGSLSAPVGITAGPDGNLWFTESGNGKVGKITTSGTITEYGGSLFDPTGITVGSDGNLWFAEFAKIDKITTSGTITGYGGSLSSPHGITAGPDGNLWFTDYGNGKVGTITTSGTITEYALGSLTGPFGITAGPDGNLWFAEYGDGRIGKIVP